MMPAPALCILLVYQSSRKGTFGFAASLLFSPPGLNQEGNHPCKLPQSCVAQLSSDPSARKRVLVFVGASARRRAAAARGAHG